MESKDPVSITDDPSHPTSETENPTRDPRKDESVNQRLEDEERPTTKRPA